MRLATSEPENAPSPSSPTIDGKVMIPELLEAAPQARPVLDRYGLRGCGGPMGPAETLEFYARAHEVPLPQLLDELRHATRRPVPPLVPLTGPGEKPPAPPETRPEDTIYRPFFKSGIAVLLSLGAAWGVYLLVRIALTGRWVGAAGFQEINAHGHAQIFGWVGLFVMGFAYQAFPRFKHTSLAWPRVAFATLGMMVVGVVAHSVAQPLATDWLLAWQAVVVASVFEVTAITLFAANILMTWRRSKRPLAFYDYYILTALGWFLVQAVYENVYLTVTLSAQGLDLITLVATWQAPLREIQIHGFVLLMILGVSQRIFHHFYGLPEPNPRLSLGMLPILNLAVIGEVAGLILMRYGSGAWSLLWYGATLVLFGAIIVLVGNWRIFAAPAPEDRDRSLKFLRAAYVWLLASLAMLVLLPLYQFGLIPLFAPNGTAAQIGSSHAYHGAARHAITVGFISLMIVGVASKVVPTLNGIPARRLTALWWPFVLINLGCVLRVTGQSLTDFTDAAFVIAGVSGFFELAGLALWGGHLWLVMSGRARQRPQPSGSAEASTEALTEGESIRASHTVGAVLEARPELLEVFTSHGFAMLANPQLRRTIARVVTIEKACRRTGLDPDEFLRALNENHPGRGYSTCASKESPVGQQQS